MVFITQEIKCPHCNHVYEASIALEVARNTHYLIVSDDWEYDECQQCGKRIYFGDTYMEVQLRYQKPTEV